MFLPVLVVLLGASPDVLRPAAQRSVDLIQKVNADWKTPCVSCHHQVLGAMVMQSARAHGLQIDEKVAQRSATRDYRTLLDLDGALRVDQLIDPALSEGSMLMGAAAAGMKPSLVTATYARHILRTQAGDGSWIPFDSRPPHSHSRFAATAIATHAVQNYYPGSGKDAVVAKARLWLESTPGRDTEDASYRLIGLVWAGGSTQKAAAELAALQRADGGWGQTPASMASDAYSTGEALYALLAAKYWKPGEAAADKATGWLIRNQAPDGSWRVSTRIHTPASVSPPYFESGFPYGRDQFISMAATTWAVRALMEQLPRSAKPAEPLPVPEFASTGVEWAEVAMFGSVDAVKQLDVRLKTREGSTALMFAAGDSEKVKALLARGARATDRTPHGIDALMVAALFNNNRASVEALLAAGAEVDPKAKVRFDMTPLAHAVIGNHLDTVDALLRKGADSNREFRLLGGGGLTPLTAAALMGNVAITTRLLDAGAKLEHADSDGMTVLSWTAIGYRTEVVQLLLKRGANREHKDKFGLTPLGHTRAVSEMPEDTAKLLGK